MPDCIRLCLYCEHLEFDYTHHFGAKVYSEVYLECRKPVNTGFESTVGEPFDVVEFRTLMERAKDCKEFKEV